MVIPFKIDNFLPDDEYRALAAESMVSMSYGSKSSRLIDPHGHWSYKPTHDKRHNLADLAPMLPAGAILAAWKRLAWKLPGHRLIRCYYNGYTYGTDGYFHVDSERAGEVTAILYLVPQWDHNWAGETVVATGASEYAAFLPAPNRLVLLPSNAAHCGRGVSRMCGELRKVLVFKARPERSNEFEAASQWLVAVGATKLNHGEDSSLHDHLMRCFQLCEDKGLPLATCRAAALHSIYGTNAFRQKLIYPTSTARADVAARWGQRVENLVYYFSIVDRPKALDYPLAELDGGVRLATTYGEFLTIGGDDLAALRLIECANLADQGQLEKWPSFKELWDA